MAASKGINFILKLGTDTFAMATSTSISMNNAPIDITTKNSGGWKETLAGTGTKSMSISMSGVYTDETYEHTLRGYLFDGSANSFTLIDENGDDYTGSFNVTSLSYSGELEGAVTFDASLESTGEVVFTQGI